MTLYQFIKFCAGAVRELMLKEARYGYQSPFAE
jgi:hypothetical protein